jgi:hypothetical protein
MTLATGGTTVTSLKRTVLLACASFVLGMPLVAACGSSGDGGTVNPTGGPSTGAGAMDAGTCLPNSCVSDAQCKCNDGRTKCIVAENRCVQCDPNTNTGCKDGEKCSSFGLCVPKDLTCPTDKDGTPTITCAANADCKACDPLHQVCDPADKKCKACTNTNTQHCLATDMCLNGKCSPKCPKECSTDNDCGQCGIAPNEAHACHNHKCSQCSKTFGCNKAKGEECVNGVCVPPCGVPGPVAGTCTAKEDCQYCGNPDPKAMPKWDCKFPVNDDKHGICVPPANGCSDLGKNVLVLPAPFDKGTQTCSKDEDCAQAKAGVQLNVGKALRDLIGTDEIDVKIKKIKIQDAFVTYPMPICAKINITETATCGLCVPCKQDADCKPIPVNPLIVELFKGDALATLAGVLLVQTLWGKGEKEPGLNFYCQQIVGGYGACLPCSNPTQACGKSSSGEGSGMCDHKVTEEGGPLKTTCSDCAKAVCTNDAYCCTTKWDKLCVDEVKQYCVGCAHNPCTQGEKLDIGCSPCVAAVCKDDPYCCNTKWDEQCTKEGKDTVKYKDCASACGAACAHSECKVGGKLDKACSSCATAVCGKDPFCCNTEWDTKCVDGAKATQGCGC